MVSLTTIEDVLYEVLAECRGTSPASVRQEVGAGGEIDSLEGVELAVAAESHFGIQIADEELSARVCSFIPQLAKLIAAKTGQAKA